MVDLCSNSTKVTIVSYHEFVTGVEGEITEENLLESVIQAMQFILSADQESLAAFVEMLEGMNVGNGSASGMISVGGMQGSVMATFNRIMSLAGKMTVTIALLKRTLVLVEIFLKMYWYSIII